MRPPKDTVQVTFRIPSRWLKKAETLAKRLTPPGERTDALRAAICKGFEYFDREERARGECSERDAFEIRAAKATALADRYARQLTEARSFIVEMQMAARLEEK